jgi:uncharacterized protein
MSSDAVGPAATPQSWPVLSLAERRVLGVLAEKAKTTPDTYPMSINALMTGCNQKSNRDPIMNFVEEEVEETLAQLQSRGLTTKILGGRVVRYKHNLYEAWQLSKVELAVLAELLLRGPQTEGELRTHASRMEPIDDLDRLRAVVRPLTERGAVVFLGPEGRRGTLITHGCHDPRELEGLRRRASADDAVAPSRVAPVPASNELQELGAEIASLRGQLVEVQEALARVSRDLQTLKDSLGS